MKGKGHKGTCSKQFLERRMRRVRFIRFSLEVVEGTTDDCGHLPGSSGCLKAVQKGIGSFVEGKCADAQCQEMALADSHALLLWLLEGEADTDVKQAERLTLIRRLDLARRQRALAAARKVERQRCKKNQKRK